jgi:predicted ester cyclase
MNDPIPSVLLRYMDGLRRHDVAAIAATVADDVAVITPARTLDKASFLAMLTALYRAFPDWRYEHDEPEARGEARFVVRWRQGGTHTAPLELPGRPPIAATGKVVRIPEQHFFYRVADERIVEIQPDPIPGGAPWGILEQVGGELPGANAGAS